MQNKTNSDNYLDSDENYDEKHPIVSIILIILLYAIISIPTIIALVYAEIFYFFIGLIILLIYSFIIYGIIKDSNEDKELVNLEIIQSDKTKDEILDEYAKNHKLKEINDAKQLKIQQSQQARIEAAKQARKEQELQERINSVNSKPHCPTCGSPNVVLISSTTRWVTTGMFGLGSSNVAKTMQCRNCGYKW